MKAAREEGWTRIAEHLILAIIVDTSIELHSVRKLSAGIHAHHSDAGRFVYRLYFEVMLTFIIHIRELSCENSTRSSSSQ